MKQTPARRQFKRMAGGTNHFLITILIGLDAVRTGRAERGPSFSTSWAPHDVVRSANRSSEFAIKALMSWTVDALDSYALALNKKPFLLQTPADRNALGAVGRSVAGRTDWLAARFRLLSEPSYALTAVAIVWRNRLVHSRAENVVAAPVRELIEATAAEIARDYQGLDVKVLLADLSQGRVPKFKEATALVRAVQTFVEHLDQQVLQILELNPFFGEALEEYVSDNPAQRIANVWGKDPVRRASSLRQLAMEHGIGESSEGSGVALADAVIDRFASLSPKEARLLLTAPGP